MSASSRIMALSNGKSGDVKKGNSARVMLADAEGAYACCDGGAVVFVLQN
jgi:hypothetical protein